MFLEWFMEMLEEEEYKQDKRLLLNLDKIRNRTNVRYAEGEGEF